MGRRLRVRFLWSRSDAPYPADNRAVVCARCLSIARWRNCHDGLVRGSALNADKNGSHLVAIRGSGSGTRINIRSACDRSRVDPGEMSNASRGTINVVRKRRVGGRIRACGPGKSHGELRMCGWRAKCQDERQYGGDLFHIFSLPRRQNAGRFPTLRPFVDTKS
jgi:hypothetical protein